MKPVVRPLLACALSVIGTSALATQFITVLDPATGQPRVLVSPGVGTGQDNPRPTAPPVIYSAQNVTLQASPQPAQPDIQYFDPAALVSSASPAIIEALIRNKNAIDQENRDLVNALRNASQPSSGQAGQPDVDRLAGNLDNLINNALRQAAQNGNNPPASNSPSDPASGSGSQASTSDPLRASALLSAAQAGEQRRQLANRLSGGDGTSQPDLRPDAPADNGVVANVLMQQIANNVQEQARPLQQALYNAANNPVPQGAAGATPPTPDPAAAAAAQEVQNALNNLTQNATNMAIQNALQGSGRSVPALDRSAGVDPEAERQRQQQRQQAEERRQQQTQQREERRQEVANNNQQLLEQIQQKAQQQQEANKKAQQEKQQEAMDRLLENMTAEQRENLQRRNEQAQARQSQDPAARSTPSTDRPTASSPATAGNNTAPTNTPASSYSDAIQALYIAYFQRPADADGLALLSNALANSRPAEFGSMPDAFSSPAESQGMPSGSQHNALINNIYMSLFGRQDDAEGLPFWTNALDPGQRSPAVPALADSAFAPSQQSLRQLDEALRQATGQVLDPWGDYIYVSRQEQTARVPEYSLNGEQWASYDSRVQGKVGDENVNGRLSLTIGFGSTTSIEGNMELNRRPGEEGSPYSLSVTSGKRSGSGFEGRLSGDAFGGHATGSLKGALYGTKAEQVGGTWSISVRDGETNVLRSGGGVFAGAQSTHD